VDSVTPSRIGPYHAHAGVRVWMINGPLSFGVSAPAHLGFGEAWTLALPFERDSPTQRTRWVDVIFPVGGSFTVTRAIVTGRKFGRNSLAIPFIWLSSSSAVLPSLSSSPVQGNPSIFKEILSSIFSTLFEMSGSYL
jgi:hypothetical protein